MAQFKDREEYERWKAERSKQAARKMTASDSAKEERLPGSFAPGVKRRTPSRPAALSDISDLFSRSWERYKERFGTLLVLCLLMLLLFLLPLGVFGGSGFALALVFPDLKAVLIGFFLTLGILLSIVTFFWGMSGLLHAVTDDSLTSREALSRGWTTVGGLIWLLSLLGFLTTGGFLLFFIPGVIFTVWFIFGQFILIEENERGMRALLRSREFVRGYGFDVFLRLFLIWIISGILGIVPFIGPILSFLFIPFTMIYVYLIYQDLKRVKGDVLIPATRGEKLKWLGTAALGYILLPVLIVALFGASLLPAILLLKGMVISPETAVFSGSGPTGETGTLRSSDIVRPANFNELLGTWSGSETGGRPGWTFSFSDGYNIHVVDPEGRWYRGMATIHWKLGADERGIRTPPGAGILDIDVTESSSGEYVGKTAVGAFSISGGTSLKFCGGEPGKTVRPESFDPTAGIRCFDLARTAAAPTAPSAFQGLSQAAPDFSVEDDEIRAARMVYKRCGEAYRAGNMSEAKRCLSQATLEETEQSGQVDMALGMISGMNIDEFQAHREGNRITFRQSQKQGDATMSMSFTMVKEGNQWKLGN